MAGMAVRHAAIARRGLRAWNPEASKADTAFSGSQKGPALQSRASSNMPPAAAHAGVAVLCCSAWTCHNGGLADGLTGMCYCLRPYDGHAAAWLHAGMPVCRWP